MVQVDADMTESLTLFFQSLSPECTDFLFFGSKCYSTQAALIITTEQLSTAKGPRFMWLKPRAETSLCLLNHTLLHNDFSLFGGHQMDWTDQMNFGITLFSTWNISLQFWHPRTTNTASRHRRKNVYYFVWYVFLDVCLQVWKGIWLSLICW